MTEDLNYQGSDYLEQMNTHFLYYNNMVKIDLWQQSWHAQELDRGNLRDGGLQGQRGFFYIQNQLHKWLGVTENVFNDVILA